jgi:hypothetical protein
MLHSNIQDHPKLGAAIIHSQSAITPYLLHTVPSRYPVAHDIDTAGSGAIVDGFAADSLQGHRVVSVRMQFVVANPWRCGAGYCHPAEWEGMRDAVDPDQLLLRFVPCCTHIVNVARISTFHNHLVCTHDIANVGEVALCGKVANSYDRRNLSGFDPCDL